MARRVRLAALTLALAFVAACGSPAAPSSAPTAASADAAVDVPRVSSDPCASALTRVEAFTRRLAQDLASLRPLATAATFDPAETVVAIRRVSATVTAFSGLDGSLRNCPRTVDLATQLQSLLGSVDNSIGGAMSVSVSAAQVQRDSSVALFALLPQVLDLSNAGNTIAKDLALDLEVAQVPDDAILPIGSLAPLPTPTPRPTPAPRPTPRPTTTAGGGGSSGSGWTASAKLTAAAYKTDAYATYDAAVREANYEIAIAGFQAPGMTPAEMAARVEQAKMKAAYDLMLVINSHFGFMNSNRPAACFADAYAADIKLGNAIWAAAKYMLDHQGSGDLSGTESGRKTFLNRLDGYFSDCR